MLQTAPSPWMADCKSGPNTVTAVAGVHVVTLNWNASASNSKSNPVVYCLYRSEQQPKITAPFDHTKCADCLRVNQTPVINTTTVDRLVENGHRYFYVALARDIHGLYSQVSNVACARIPDPNDANQKITDPCPPQPK
jgi:hypothetical protein